MIPGAARAELLVHFGGGVRGRLRLGPGPLISRRPADLPVFNDTFVTEFSHAAKHRK